MTFQQIPGGLNAVNDPLLAEYLKQRTSEESHIDPCFSANMHNLNFTELERDGDETTKSLHSVQDKQVDVQALLTAVNSVNSEWHKVVAALGVLQYLWQGVSFLFLHHFQVILIC